MVEERTLTLAPREERSWAAPLAVAAVYYAGAKIGFALTFEPFPLSVLWPPNALLLACLLLAPTCRWWLLIAAAFPAHMLAELQDGVPVGMVLCWFVSNVAEALMGALFIRRVAGPKPTLVTVREVVAFSFGAVLASILSSFLDAGFVRLTGWRNADYWTLWYARVFSNMLATLTFAPIVLTWAAVGSAQVRRVADSNLLEAATLLVGLVAVSFVAFDSVSADPTSTTSLLYLPLPFLLWAALRFGPQMTSIAFTVVAFSVVWGAGHGHGPFLEAARQVDAFPIQLFLISVAVPTLLLAAMIEERRRAEQQLRASEDLFSTAFRSTPDAIAISRRRDGRLIEANDRWLDLLGYERSELERGLIGPLTAHVDDAGRQVLAALERDGADSGDVEVTVRDRRGGERRALVRINAVEMGGEACVIGIVRDITAQRYAERQAHEQRQQLTHLSRVASLSDFSSALAHELNQPLTAILANAQAGIRLMSRDPPDMSEIRAVLLEIAEADKRAGDLIHHLRLLMKRGEEEFAPIDLNEVVREVLDLLHGEFVKRDVDLQVTLASNLPHVSGNRVQLQQLVLNLACNAMEAIDGQPTRSKKLQVTAVHSGDGLVRLVVSDTGPGIPTDQLERIFDPFFTTKENGLGLGLPISRDIARAHSGELWAERGEGKGATFQVVLPALKSSSTLASAAS